VVGDALGVETFTLDTNDPVEICRAGAETADHRGFDAVILDTAGRLHIDDELMRELERIQAGVTPHETLLVLDGMTGQDAVNVASSFAERLEVTGAVLTKMDGDARGGAALSMRHVTGVPLKFVGVGEKSDALEEFHPDRMASRILGMGDVVSLVEKAQEAIDEKDAVRMAEKLRKDEFTFEDFLEQMEQLKKMGPLEDLLKMIPGMGKQLKGIQVDEKQMARTQAIIQSMTRQERLRPAVINGSRRKRIAKGSGTQVQDVNRLLKQFRETQKLMKRMRRSKGRFKMPLGF
jgi:signal recognition particle subunit SRP54